MRRSRCAGAFRESARAFRVIGKVARGQNAARLLYYLFGPGRANEHTDPHLVAGFGDPGELEPERRLDGSRDFRRLAGLLAQPLALLIGPSYDKPVWHCSIRAAPEDRTLSDAEWARVATGVMARTGLAPEGDEFGVRWVAVRHAPDHIHIVATLARQDGIRPETWNDFYRVRDTCREAERWFGLRSTAPADRTAARRATRAEKEQAGRRGWAEPPRAVLRRAVSAAAGGAGTEQKFFARLGEAGILVRMRYSTANPDQVTGYAVGLPHHTSKDGGVIWYGGGKLAADLTLPKLRARWVARAEECLGPGFPPQMARAVLRARIGDAAEQARGEAEFFSHLRRSGVLVRLRFSETDPGQVTGYAVTYARRPHHQRRSAPVVRGRAAGRRGDLASATPSVEPTARAGRTPRVPVHRRGARTAVPVRGTAGRGRRGADPSQRRERPDCGRRCGLGGGRSIRCHSGRAARPGAAGRSGRLRPRGPSAVRADPGPHRGR
jgi:hypothetical protein